MRASIIGLLVMAISVSNSVASEFARVETKTKKLSNQGDNGKEEEKKKIEERIKIFEDRIAKIKARHGRK